jgi:DNA-binding CsgD family transcriptional regulator
VWEAGAYQGSLFGLSPRESNVLELVVLGHTNQQIADTLYLSINSVKTYIRSAYRKTGVSTRGQAVAWGIQHGFSAEQIEPTPRHGPDLGESETPQPLRLGST